MAHRMEEAEVDYWMVEVVEAVHQKVVEVEAFDDFLRTWIISFDVLFLWMMDNSTNVQQYHIPIIMVALSQGESQGDHNF